MRASASANPEVVRQFGPFDRQVGQAPVAPDEAEDAVHRLAASQSQAMREAQQRQRIERMLGRKLERNAELLRLPDARSGR